MASSVITPNLDEDVKLAQLRGTLMASHWLTRIQGEGRNTQIYTCETTIEKLTRLLEGALARREAANAQDTQGIARS